MSRLDLIASQVKELYESKQPGRDEISDFIYEGHVLPTAEIAKELCEEFSGNPEYAVAGALMHDIGDAIMSRFGEDFDEKSNEIAREFMVNAGYSSEEIELVIVEVIKPHSCHKGDRQPEDVNGKILATADAMAHLCTDMYLYWCWNHMIQKESLIKFKVEALKKLERDFNDKIQWEIVRERVRPDYEALVRIFSR